MSRLTPATAEDLAPATRAFNQGRITQQYRANGRAQAFRQADRHTVKRCGDGSCLDTFGDRCVVKASAIKVEGQLMLLCQCARFTDVSAIQHPAMPGVLQGQQTRAGKMRIAHRFDRRTNGVQWQSSILALRNWLWLDRAQNGGTTAFVLVGMRIRADQILVTALAVRHQGQQIRLRATADEQRGGKAQLFGQIALQCVHTGIVAKHIVTHRSRCHRCPHRVGGLSDGVAAQIDQTRSHEGFQASRASTTSAACSVFSAV